MQVISSVESPLVSGQNANLLCQVIGACALELTFQLRSFSNDEVTTTQLSTTTINENGMNETFVIDSYDESYEGVFNCIINRDNDTIVSRDTGILARKCHPLSIVIYLEVPHPAHINIYHDSLRFLYGRRFCNLSL